MERGVRYIFTQIHLKRTGTYYRCSIAVLGEAVREAEDFDGFDVGGFDDGLAFTVFFEVLFVAAGDGRDFGDDFFAETEEDVGVGLFEDVAVDVFGVLGDHEEAEFVFAALFDGVAGAVDNVLFAEGGGVGDVVVGFVDGDEEWRVFDVRIDVVVVDLVVDDVREDGEDREFFFCAVEMAGRDDGNLAFAEHGV